MLQAGPVARERALDDAVVLGADGARARTRAALALGPTGGLELPVGPALLGRHLSQVRLVILLALAAAAAMLLAASAPAATTSELTGVADRAAAVWAGRQDRGGFFLDPRTGRRSEGYGNVMTGYALLRAGERRKDARLIAAGVRGIGTALDEPPAARGVFDLLSMAAAFTFARDHLADDPAFTAARPRWEAYLQATGAANIENEVRDCIVSPACFHNHEAVGAVADLQLLATGLRSAQPGTQLADADALRRAAVFEVGTVEPSFARGDAAWVGEEADEDLALLSDSGNWPLSYHALSTAMLGRSVELLGDDAPDAARAALRRTTGALAALMAPDGTVSYIGKRQESLWSLAATVAAAELALAGADAGNAARSRYRAAADRALARIRARYPLTPRGLPIVPRDGADAFSTAGVDGDPMTFNGLALFLLNLAADAAPEDEGGDAPALPADGDGAFVERAQNGFAAVRRGNVWFAVHRRDPPRDLRNDFGLVAAKWRAPSGGWIDVVRPRPMAFDDTETAGPVVERDGRRVTPVGESIALEDGGAVVVRGLLGEEPTAFRFTPAGRGVRMTFWARAGDVVTYTAYLPADEAEVAGAAVSDRGATVSASPRPASIALYRGFASCCDARMVAARMRIPVRADGTVTITTAARADARAPAPIGPAASGGGPSWWAAALAVVALAGLTLGVLARRRTIARRVRRRRRTRR